ncbi:hypothetical protein VTO42DRAFT_7141 [Malbranchea cinnamomea]
MPGEEITLMNWGNAIVRDIVNDSQGRVTSLSLELNLDGDVKKTRQEDNLAITRPKTYKIEKEEDISKFITPQTEFRSEAWADCNVTDLVEGDIIQFKRKGYYRLDRAFKEGTPAGFFAISSGKKAKNGE